MVVTVAALSTAEVTRIARYLNVPLGVVLIVGGLCFALHSPVVVASDLICGIALICAAIPRGAIAEKYASWDRFVR